MDKYIVVIVKMVEDVHGPDDVSVRPDCGGVVPCETTREVAEVVASVNARKGETEEDWAVYELVSGRYVRRAITFVVDVDVS